MLFGPSPPLVFVRIPSSTSVFPARGRGWEPAGESARSPPHVCGHCWENGKGRRGSHVPCDEGVALPEGTGGAAAAFTLAGPHHRDLGQEPAGLWPGPMQTGHTWEISAHRREPVKGLRAAEDDPVAAGRNPQWIQLTRARKRQGSCSWVAPGDGPSAKPCLWLQQATARRTPPRALWSPTSTRGGGLLPERSEGKRSHVPLHPATSTHFTACGS